MGLRNLCSAKGRCKELRYFFFCIIRIKKWYNVSNFFFINDFSGINKKRVSLPNKLRCLNKLPCQMSFSAKQASLQWSTTLLSKWICFTTSNKNNSFSGVNKKRSFPAKQASSQWSRTFLLQVISFTTSIKITVLVVLIQKKQTSLQNKFPCESSFAATV